MDVSANTRISRGERVFHGLAAGLLAAVFLASFLAVDRWRLGSGGDADREGNTLCVLRHLTGLPCLTCGMTRSFCAISRCRFVEALEHHPLGPVVYAVLAVTMIRSAWIAAVGRRRLDRIVRVLIWSIPVLALAALALWAVRLWILFAGGAGVEAWHASPLARLLAGP
ncbi:MAG TPA: DUF2752 domain-containing protein [Phycisphaerae bacterium]|nr:DUF2752 domain-containing protein [Phycisphaerae bacterium]